MVPRQQRAAKRHLVDRWRQILLRQVLPKAEDNGPPAEAKFYYNPSLKFAAGFLFVVGIILLMADYSPAGIRPATVFAGGHSFNGSTWVAGYWKDGAWVALANSYGTYNAYVLSLMVSGSDVYAGGYSVDGSGGEVAGYWKDGTWAPLANSYSAHGAGVTSLVVSGVDIYAGGAIVNSSGVAVAGYWKNDTWVPLSNSYDEAQVNSLVIVQ